MTSTRLIRVLLTTLPAFAFWISLIVWVNGNRPGENYWPMIRQFGLLAVSLVAFLAFAITAIIMSFKKKDSLEWWIGAFANPTPMLALALFRRLHTSRLGLDVLN